MYLTLTFNICMIVQTYYTHTWNFTPTPFSYKAYSTLTKETNCSLQTYKDTTHIKTHKNFTLAHIKCIHTTSANTYLSTRKIDRLIHIMPTQLTVLDLWTNSMQVILLLDVWKNIMAGEYLGSQQWNTSLLKEWWNTT